MTREELEEKYPSKEFGYVKVFMCPIHMVWGFEVNPREFGKPYDFPDLEDAKAFLKNLTDAIKYCEERL